MQRLFRAGSGLVCLGLSALCLPAHALSLGNLTVSSNASPSFTASLPFSDDKPVRLPELQTRLATDAEYAQWGMQMAPVVRELRVRVVPASQTVGYVELFSPNALSQDNFDLLVWAAYAGQTMLTHYKVSVLDVPSLVKGKTLSTSPSSGTQRQGKDLPPKSGVEKPANVMVSSEATLRPLADSPSAPKRVEPPRGDESAAVLPPVAVSHASPPPVAAAVNAPLPVTASDPQTDNSMFGSGLVILLFSLMLFLFGFWMGRLRSRNMASPSPQPPHQATARPEDKLDRPSLQPGHINLASPATSPESHTLTPLFDAPPRRQSLSSSPLPNPGSGVQPAKSQVLAASTSASEVPPPLHEANLTPSASSAAPEQPSAQPLSATPALETAAPVAEHNLNQAADGRSEPFATPLDSLSASVMASQALRLHAEPVEPSELSEWTTTTSRPTSAVAVAAASVVTRTPATALPTPGLVSVSGRSKKAGKTKSLGDSNIDLAKIYMSMGDPTTAQMLLQQVMAQGTEAEKAQAEQLMQEMV
jgi:FimV-like protein